jgi:glutaredoxin 2
LTQAARRQHTNSDPDLGDLQRQALLVRANSTHLKTIDEMLNPALLAPDRRQQISAWLAQANSPEEILKMPTGSVAGG